MRKGDMIHSNPPGPPIADEYTVMVLLVDDQVMVGEAVRRALAEDPNIDFHYCPDPARAIAAAGEVKPTVILQDLVMPGVDGLTLVREYRANADTRDIPIIVLSTEEDPAVKGEAFVAGANDYLVKLPDRIELIARIRYHSKAYLNQRQRDEAYRALRDSQRQLMEMNFELSRLTSVDGLTGLGNRRYLDEMLDAEWKRAGRAQCPLSVLMIDVDHFKQYNDTYGHLAGDEVLRQVAAVVQKCAGRATDLAARFGGEEFALLLPVTDLAGTVRLAEKVRNDVENLRLPHACGLDGRISVSIGGTCLVPHRTESSYILVDAADRALYEAKRGGRNRVVVHDRESLPATA
ncbi:diguanylate cyclase [Azoarcus sp. KH32C]|uniref:diguanylate cyclase n=1 Tax=Azoarcus sp. KH32C TaxID=748247 RepID=UPI0002385B93|nr:diguanylate cyclase [Azoarcus sp. KH32C]BAL27270.1 regulatory components of sensory transduction system [Azoarcus sp. KH32C]